jgi:hypothetical protein
MATPAAPASRFKFKDEGRDVAAEAVAGAQARSGIAEGGVLTELKPDTSYLHPAAGTPAPAVNEPPATETSTAPPEPAPTTTTSTAPPAVPPPVAEPVKERLFVGKFKTAEDLEKAYTELEKGFTAKSQEAATLKKAAVTPVVTPEESEAQRLARINAMLTDPDKFERDMADRITAATRQSALEQQETAERMTKWNAENKDLDNEDDKFRVAAEVYRLTAQDPGMDPWAALQQATTNHRTYTGTIFDRGKKEALTVQQSVTTPAAVKVNTPPPTEQPSPAPMTDKDAAKQHMEFLRSEAARVRRPVR